MCKDTIDIENECPYLSNWFDFFFINNRLVIILTALAGKARNITGVRPLNKAETPSVLTWRAEQKKIQIKDV